MREIPLANGRGIALVDDEDYETLAKSRWFYSVGGYAVRAVKKHGKQTMYWMHRDIVQPPDDLYVDHINGNGLDNRRANLRACTSSQNHQNARKRKDSKHSRYKGVGLYSSRGWTSWTACLFVNGKKIHIGYFRDEQEAAQAYDDAARKHFGEFARLNFPRAGEQAA